MEIEAAVGADQYQTWFARGGELDLDGALQLARDAVARRRAG